jgi:hypothetical protein
MVPQKLSFILHKFIYEHNTTIKITKMFLNLEVCTKSEVLYKRHAIGSYI